MDFIKKPFPKWHEVKLIVFDFDGVFTNNKVYLDQNGNEIVCCDRGDGLGFDILRKFIKKNNWDLKYFILSKEKNNVVSQRSKKLQINCYQNIAAKRTFLIQYIKENFNNIDEIQKKTVYLGNDLNDIETMDIVGYFLAPKDAHPLVKKEADYVLDRNGGEGFVRAFIEKLLEIDQFDKKDFESYF